MICCRNQLFQLMVFVAAMIGIFAEYEIGSRILNADMTFNLMCYTFIFAMLIEIALQKRYLREQEYEHKYQLAKEQNDYIIRQLENKRNRLKKINSCLNKLTGAGKGE